MNTCEECRYLQGDECMKYTGPTNPECGLLNDHWYKIDELINALICAASENGTEPPEEPGNCICLRIEGFNKTEETFNAMGLLEMHFYADSEKTNLIASKIVYMRESFGVNFNWPLDYDIVYPDIKVIFQRDNPNWGFFTSGMGVDLIIVANGIIRYARSIGAPTEGDNFFDGIPESLPTGLISVYLLENRLDTNEDPSQGVIAVGGEKLPSSPFTFQTTTVGGGSVNNPNLVWPLLDEEEITDFAYTNFEMVSFDQVASSLKVVISGTNNESFSVKLELLASLDQALSFTDTVEPGAIYQKEVEYTPQQATDNDFLIRILKVL